MTSRKPVSLFRQTLTECILALLLQLVIASVASLGILGTVTASVGASVGLFYLRKVLPRVNPQTKFFLAFSVTSAALTTLVLAKLVSSNARMQSHGWGLLALASLSVYFWVETKSRTKRNIFTYAVTHDDKVGEKVCEVCVKRVPENVFHCRMCQACIISPLHHCVWLDCCIGQGNLTPLLLALTMTVTLLTCELLVTVNTSWWLSGDFYSTTRSALCVVAVLYSAVLDALLSCTLAFYCWLLWTGRRRTEKTTAIDATSDLGNGGPPPTVSRTPGWEPLA